MNAYEKKILSSIRESERCLDGCIPGNPNEDTLSKILFNEITTLDEYLGLIKDKKEFYVSIKTGVRLFTVYKITANEKSFTKEVYSEKFSMYGFPIKGKDKIFNEQNWRKVFGKGEWIQVGSYENDIFWHHIITKEYRIFSKPIDSSCWRSSNAV